MYCNVTSVIGQIIALPHPGVSKCTDSVFQFLHYIIYINNFTKLSQMFTNIQDSSPIDTILTVKLREPTAILDEGFFCF